MKKINFISAHADMLHIDSLRMFHEHNNKKHTRTFRVIFGLF